MSFVTTGVGKVIREVEVRTVGQSKLATFTVVSNRGVKKGEDDDGKTLWDNIGTFLEVKAWGRLADLAEKLTNQDVVEVSGELQQEHWEKDGTKRSKFVLNANLIKQIKFKSGEENVESTEQVVDEVPF